MLRQVRGEKKRSGKMDVEKLRCAVRHALWPADVLTNSPFADVKADPRTSCVARVAGVEKFRTKDGRYGVTELQGPTARYRFVRKVYSPDKRRADVQYGSSAAFMIARRVDSGMDFSDQRSAPVGTENL